MVLKTAVLSGYTALGDSLYEAIAQMPSKIRQPERDFLEPEKPEKVLLAARVRSEEICASIPFALHTGARAGEQITLEWGDIDFRSRWVVFRGLRGSSATPTALR